MTNYYIEKFPKIDLHCHLDGSMSLETVKQIAEKEKIQIPSSDQEILAMMTAPENCQSLIEYLKCFDLPISCIQSDFGLKTAAYNLIKTAYEENVIYIEVRFAPLLSVSENFSARQVVKSVLLGLRKGFEDFGVYSSLILCGMRHHSVDNSMELVDIALENLANGVSAIDLAGDEVSFPPIKFKKFLDYAKEKGVPYTIHAGENGPASNVYDAVSMGTKRIGHGIAIMNNAEYIKFCKDENVTLEMCPISNIQTKAAKNWEEYPFRKFLDYGLNITINTDNRTVSNTSSTKELINLNNIYNLTEQVLKEISLNSVKASFTTDEVKEILTKKITEYI